MTIVINSIPELTFTTVPSTKSVNIIVHVDDTPKTASVPVTVSRAGETASSDLTATLAVASAPTLVIDVDALATAWGFLAGSVTAQVNPPVNAGGGEWQFGVAITVDP